MRTSIFTAMMRAEFLKSMHAQQGVPVAPWEGFTTKINSTARIEEYPWMSTVPTLSEYTGKRRFANVDTTKYSIVNKEFDASFMVNLRDVEDDQVGGYKLLPAELVTKAKLFPGYLVYQHLKKGKSERCFDGTYFFANSHQIGSGDNLMAGTAAASDGVAHNVVFLMKTGQVKPLIYQERKALQDIQTNEGSSEMKETKKIKYWVDTEMAPGYGYWWDALLVEFANTPTLTELQNMLGEVENQFRTFELPKSLDTDQPQRPHEQWVPSPSSIAVLTSTTLGSKMRTILESETIVQSGAAVTNIYRGWGELIQTAELNGALS